MAQYAGESLTDYINRLKTGQVSNVGTNTTQTLDYKDTGLGRVLSGKDWETGVAYGTRDKYGNTSRFGPDDILTPNASNEYMSNMSSIDSINAMKKQGYYTNPDGTTTQLSADEMSGLNTSIDGLNYSNNELLGNKSNYSQTGMSGYEMGQIGLGTASFLGNMYNSNKNYNLQKDAFNENKRMNQENLSMAKDQLYGKDADGNYYSDTKDDRVAKSLGSAFGGGK